MCREGLPTYKSLGYWDLLTVTQVDSLSATPHTPQAAIARYVVPEHVHRAAHELCYSWEGNCERGWCPLPTISSWPSAPCLGVCMVKLRGEAIHEDGLYAVEHVADALATMSGQLLSERLTIGGGLSWADLVLLLFSDDFPTILHDVLALNDRVSADGLPVLKTVTIPCFHYGATRSRSGCGRASVLESRKHPELGPVTAEVLVTVSSAGLRRVLEPAEKHLGRRGRLLLGDADVLTTLDADDCEVVPKLLRLRAAAGDDLIATATRLVAGHEAALVDSGGTAASTGLGRYPLRPPVKLARPSRRVLARLSQHDEPLARNIEALYECAISYASDPLTRDGMDDVLLPLQSLSERLAVNGRFYAHGSFLSYLWACYKDLSMAVRQRMASMQRFANGDYQPPAVTVTAYHKLMRAAGAVVEQMLAACEEQWEGCIVVDWEYDFMNLKSGLITVPHDRLSDPLEWWGLGHETGHEHVRLTQNWLWEADLRPYGCDHKFPHLLKRAAEVLGYSPDSAQWFWEELYAEVYDFVVAMGGDWDFYLDTAYQYVQMERHRDQREEFIYRASLVRLAHAARTGEVDRAAPSLTEEAALDLCDRLMDELMPRSQDMYAEWLQDGDAIRAIREVLMAWWPVLRVTAAVVEARSRVGTDSSAADAAEVAAEWASGVTCIPPSGAWCPLKILRASPVWMEEKRFSTDIAAVLSLWHASVTQSRTPWLPPMEAG